MRGKTLKIEFCGLLYRYSSCTCGAKSMEMFVEKEVVQIFKHICSVSYFDVDIVDGWRSGSG